MEYMIATLKHLALTHNLERQNNASAMTLVMKIENPLKMNSPTGLSSKKLKLFSMKLKNPKLHLLKLLNLLLKSKKRLLDVFLRRKKSLQRKQKIDLRKNLMREQRYKLNWILTTKQIMNLILRQTQNLIKQKWQLQNLIMPNIKQKLLLRMLEKLQSKPLLQINMSSKLQHRRLRLKLLIRRGMLSLNRKKLMLPQQEKRSNK